MEFIYHGEMIGFMKHIVDYHISNLHIDKKDKFAQAVREQCKKFRENLKRDIEFITVRKNGKPVIK